jgi:hypothetical protein
MMGYYVSGSGNVRIKKDDLGKAYEAMMALQERTDLMGGGSYSAEKTTKFFSWMPENLRTIPNAKDVFLSLGFEVQDEDDGGILIFAYDSKIGDERWFFAAAAPFMSGEFEWTGEDGEKWKWMFEDDKMIEWTGVNVHYKFDEEVKL